MSIGELIMETIDHGNINELIGLAILSVGLVSIGFIFIIAMISKFND